MKSNKVMYVIIAIAVVVIAFVAMKPKATTTTTTPTMGNKTNRSWGDIPAGTTFDKLTPSNNAGNSWVTWNNLYVEVPNDLFYI